MFSGYAYARLGASYPSNGGIIDFFRRGLGNGVFAGALVIVPVDAGGEYRHGRPCFGAYAVQFCMKAAVRSTLFCLYALGIIAVMTLFNSLSNHAVGRLEVILVGIKMMILLLLIIAGVWSLQPAHISVSAPPPSSGRSSSCIGITFLAYAGFGMMANAADKVKDPEVIMPRAFLVAIGVTTLLYISLALVLLSDVSALELENMPIPP